MEKADALIIALGQTGAGEKNCATQYYGEAIVEKLFNNGIIYKLLGVGEEYIFLTRYGEEFAKNSFGIEAPIAAALHYSDTRLFDCYSKLSEEEQMSWENRNRILEKFTGFYGNEILWVPDGEYIDKDNRRIAVELPIIYKKRMIYKNDDVQGIDLYDLIISL